MSYEFEDNAKHKKEFDHSINRTSQMITIPRGNRKRMYNDNWERIFMKECNHCKRKLSKKEFHKNKNNSDGLAKRCKSCSAQSNKSFCNSEKGRRYKFNQKLKQYGLTFDEYMEILVKQKNRCANCRREQTDLNRLFHVDHNHKTGKVRGLLCSNCNTALGLLKEDFLIINNLKRYLKNSYDY